MVEMDITDTEFDPELDEPTWEVLVITHQRQYEFENINTAQKEALLKLGSGYDYWWSEDGTEDFIWAKPVERITVSRGRTLRQRQEAQRILEAHILRGVYY